jgi:hypothetical protein
MKLAAPHVARNRDHILKVLQGVLPEQGTVLEIASGSGEHAVYFAARFPGLVWQPSDPDPQARASIAAWIADSGLDNLLPPLDLDVLRPVGLPARTHAVLNMNMLHISPRAACAGLMSVSGAVLEAGAPLFLYGPFLVEGRETAPSNLGFDASLRDRDPDWGIRRLEDVAAAGETHGLALERTVDMPANNLAAIFRKR